MRSVFKNPEAVREQMKLPAVISYSFIGLSTPAYHARLESIVMRIAGPGNVVSSDLQASSGGKYTAYRFSVFHNEFEGVEAMYREVGALEGTKMVL